MADSPIRDVLERAIANLREQLEREFGAHAGELKQAAAEAHERAMRLSAEVGALNRTVAEEREHAAQLAAEIAAADMRREAEMHAQIAQLQEGARQRIEELQRDALQERERAVQQAATAAAANVRRQADADIAQARATAKKELDEVRDAADKQIGAIRHNAQVELNEVRTALQAQLEETRRTALAQADEIRRHAGAEIEEARRAAAVERERAHAAAAEVEQARVAAAAQIEDARRTAAAEAAAVRNRAEEQVAHLRHDMEARLNDLRSRAAAEVEDARAAAAAARTEAEAAVRTARAESDAALQDLRAESDAALRAARAAADAAVRAARAEAEEVVIAQLASAQAETEKKIEQAIERTRTDAHQAELAHAAALVDAFRRLDDARSLSDVLDTLAECAGHVVQRAAVLVVRGEKLRIRRLAGFSGEPAGELAIAEAGIAGGVIESGATVARSAGGTGVPTAGVLPAFATGVEAAHALALPVTVGGRVVAVLYGDAPRNGASAQVGAWPAVLEVLARHASRVLEALTVEQAAGLSVARTARPPRSALPGPLEHGGTGDHDAARRYARLLVSELRMYHEPTVDAGRRSRDLRARLGEEIDRARRLYEQRVPSSIRERSDYFEQELVRTLADGNPALLG